jgi:hypothetical protein
MPRSFYRFPQMTANNKYLLFVIAISSILLLNVLITPSTFDNAIVQSMALDLYRFGRLPFIGSWDQSWPGIDYIYYVAIYLFGTSDFSLHLFEALLQLSFSIFLFRFWSRWLRPRTAALAAILYVMYYVGANRWLYATRDVYVMMSVLIATNWLQPKDNVKTNGFFLLLAGSLALGFSILLRPTSLLFYAIYLIYSFYQERSLSNTLRTLIIATLSLLPLAIILLYYNMQPDGLRQFYLATIQWNLDLYTKIPGIFSYLPGELARRIFLIGSVLFAFANRGKVQNFFRRLPRKHEKVLYVSLIIGSFFIVILMHKFYPYHFAPFFMLLTPLAALGIDLFASRFKTISKQRFAIAIACFLSTFIAFVPRSPLAFALALTEGRDPQTFTYLAEYRDSTWGAKKELAVRDYLERPENREGPIEVCSYNPMLRLHLNRYFAGIYVVLDPIALRTNDDSIHPTYTSYQLEWQRQYMDSLRIRKPRFIILARTTSWYYLHDPYTSFLHYLPGFDSLLSASYVKDTTIGGFEIYKRQTASVSGSK